ncbi:MULTISPECIES: SGNH/GDSL hydrolase family protein [unclassified Streptomyces]|uniref:SGNH/GDSL hydrolase family protein n=1 Tax=unclassified Streptomyces TaxID=2593676 RepID=UPI0022539F89|nr:MULTISPECIES: SGNH/GDSL hydrolase family protein [unclassified Streptomyces]MCX4791683.1 SGNH/GDSL hydrolase family protein [Streptomyces sp. NBC_01221]MCX4792691.1 SGNH/GDSL hydrolase family protein [Streptomyces sp. NBC_01242]WSP60620.1 SGNH/GDSL hydrolase family protein [Streptomyces sp. NBC_01240]WSU19691.1 SGNH/GDSL hydrolase family protein [Streptomyces sp. NBC_01108]
MHPLLMPVVAAQALFVRMSTETLPPADGPESGTAGEAAGAEPLRIAVVGESTAAGCGVEQHEEGFTGQFARELSVRTGRPVDWSVHGRYGATARRIRYRLLPELDTGLHVVALLAGVNDVLTRRSPQDWGDDLGAVVGELAQRADQVVVTGIPPFAEFPSIPGVLGRYLGERAAVLDEVAQRVCAEVQGVTWIGSTNVLPMGPDFFARDRFHPSAQGYREWAQIVAGKVAL